VKLNSFVSAICFSLLISLAGAQSRELEFFFSDGRSARVTENRLAYSIFPGAKSMIGIRAMTGSDERLNFDQKSRRASMEMDLFLTGKLMTHQFLSGYEYLYDASALEQELSPYQNKTAFLGYGAIFQPLDSLSISFTGKGFIRREQDRYAADRSLKSDGYQALAALRASAGLGETQLGFSAQLDGKSLDWEAYRQSTLNAWMSYGDYVFAIQQNFNWDYREDDLYVLQPDSTRGREGSYSRSDRQTRNSIAYNAFIDYLPSETMRLRFSDVLSRRYISLKENAVRSNTDLLNQAVLDLDGQILPRLSLNARALYNYGIKDFNYLGNTRRVELRGLSSRLGWEYLDGDSLVATASVELQRTLYPEDQHRWDNDLLTKSLRLGMVHYWKKRIKLSGWMSWNIRDDVYIDGVLSSNNKQVNSIILQPDCSILIGDRLSFKQNYLIRADYTKSMYENPLGEQTRSLYRQLGYRYSLCFDSFPFIARSGDPIWLQLPYRSSHDNAFLVEASFGYEQNDYADYIDTYYSIVSKNIRKSAGLLLKHDIRSLYYIIEPRFSWGTWREYSLLLGLAWRFNNLSLLEVSINPIAEDLDDPDWRSSVNLSLRF